MRRYDVVVIGLGAFGSAATYHLARSGTDVLGIDRFSPPHDLGSTHGESRITRMATGEGAEYAPLALRSRRLWRAIERANARLPGHAEDQPLFIECGCLQIFGPSTKALHHGVTNYFLRIGKSARTYKIRHTEFSSGQEIRAAYPQFAVAADDRAFLDHWGGYLRPEACVETQLRLAQHHGATIRRGVAVKSIESSNTAVTITTNNGQTFAADRALVTAGPWLPGFLPKALRRRLAVTRQVLNWFEIESNPERFAPTNCPVFIWDVSGRAIAGSRRRPKSVVYGFPLVGNVASGLKVTHEELGPVVDPDHVPRRVTRAEIAYAYDTYIRPFLPDVGPRSLRTATCLYTNVAQGRFVIDRHPEHRGVLFASACSGHGFKHSAAVGEALAEMMQGRAPSHVDLKPFTVKRLEARLAQ